MFKQMRDALDISKPTDILTHIASLPEPQQTHAKDQIKQIERTAMTSQRPQPGLREMVEHFTRKLGPGDQAETASASASGSESESSGVRLALCTRNFELPVRHLLDTFLSPTQAARFWPVVTRETEGIAPKPSAEGIWACVHTWLNHGQGVEPPRDHEVHNARIDTEALRRMSYEDKRDMCRGVVMVGDSVDDIEAGCRAGATTVLLVNGDNRYLLDGESVKEHAEYRRVDFAIESLEELIELFDGGVGVETKRS